jgi:hypothetical protein
MANHIYAKSEFSDVNGFDWQITIRKLTDREDQDYTFNVGPEGFVLTYENPDEYDILTAVVPSTVEFTMMFDPSDRGYFSDMYTDILSGEDGLFAVEIHKDQDNLNVLWWRGYILPEAITVEDITPYEQVVIRAVDGLAALSNVKYDVRVTTGDFILSHINQCLKQIPYLELYGVADKFTTVVDDFKASNGALSTFPYSVFVGHIAYLKVAKETFFNKDNDGNAQYFDCRFVLESFCKSMNCRLYQYKGHFHIIPLGALQSGADFLGGSYSTVATTTGAAVNIKEEKDYGGSTSTFFQKRGWVQTALPPHGEIKIERNYQGDKAIVQRTNYTLGTTIEDEDSTYLSGKRFRVSGNFLYRFTGISAGTTDNNRYGRIKLSIRLQLGASPTTTNNQYIHRAYSMGTTTYIHVSGDQYDNDFANSLELGADAYGPIEWTNVSTDTYDLVLPFIIDRENGTGQTLQDGYYLNKQFTFVTPELPSTEQSLELSITATGINADGTTNSDFLDTNYADYQARNIKVEYTSGTQEQQFGTVEIKAIAEGRYNVDLGQTIVGDRIASEQFGIITTSIVGGSYVECDDWISRMSSTSGLSINKLAVNERMGFYKQGKVIQRGTLVCTRSSEFLTLHTIVTSVPDGYDYNVSSLRFVANSQEYDVTLIRKGRNISAITLAQDNDKPSKDVTANDPGNVPNNTFGNIKGDDIIQTVMNNYNARARAYGQQNWSSVFATAGERLECYWTIANDGQGRWFDFRGEIPTAGYAIQRSIYVITRGLQQSTDSPWQTPAALQPAQGDSLKDCIELCQEYVNKVGDHGSYTFVISYNEIAVTSYILDAYSGATAAYSLRKLREDYVGAAVVVRRSSDSQTSSIGFDANGDFNTTALSSFIGSDTAYVVAWYDQTGNGNHLIQSSTGAQPRIANVGLIYTLNGKPSIYFDGSNDSLPAGSAFDANSGVNELVVAWVGSATNLAANNVIVSQWDTGLSNQIFEIQLRGDTDNLRYMHRYSNGTLSTVDNGSAITSGAQYIVVGHTEQNKHEAWFEGVKQTGTNVNATPGNATTSFRVGARSDSAINPHQGYTQEVIVWSSASHLHTASDISDDINDYYGSY